ncbi:uncharacterized protein LOC119602965 [Lucilia sericata]|uniref:uncharacterized protein LOC119602965 n=1 Tax=Lucilia sericata TaxID=13632 RepID=UPI0018A86047|nr:uncharacterized protein LOC119602965 [Lucilia sericata]
MSKFVIFAVLLTFVICLTALANGQPQRLDANSIIQKIIGQYEARIKGPSVIHPEEPAHVIDPNHFHLHI